MASGSMRARTVLLAVAASVVLTVLVAAGPALIGPAAGCWSCAVSSPSPVAAGEVGPQGNATTTTTSTTSTSVTPPTTTSTVEETTTTVEETTTTAAPVVTTAPPTTRRAPPPTTTTVVEVELTTTTLAMTTSTDLLVPGDGTEGAESTTTTEAIAAISNEDSGPSDGTLIGVVVAGLVLIALVVSILTWRYWAATRPMPVEGEGRPAPAG